MSVNVDKLVNEGYLERKPVENDRRKTELVCTKRPGLSLKEEGVYSSSLQQICLQG